MLRKSALMAALYTYFIANAGVRESIWLASEAVTRLKKDIGATTQRRLTEAMGATEDGEEAGRTLIEALNKITEKIEYDLERGIEVIRSIARLNGADSSYIRYEEKMIEELRSAAEAEKKHLKETLHEYSTSKDLILPRPKKRRLRKLEREASAITPKRIYKGPISVYGYTHRPWTYNLSEEDQDELWNLQKKYREARGIAILALYWVDGERNLLDISRLVELETGHTDLKFLKGYFKSLEKMKLIELS